MGLIKSFTQDFLKVWIYSSREEMGSAAAQEFGSRFLEEAAGKPEIRMVFAAAPSQNEFLKYLVSMPGLPWDKVVAFHMDEYLGLPAGDKRLFQEFLGERIFSRAGFRKVQLLSPWKDDPQDECSRYAELLNSGPIDMVALGIGENGHVAFNDPPVADFGDPETVKIVELETACRQQQVNDGAFPAMDRVPTHALTLTIPALLRGESLFCIVPGSRKAEAVTRTLKGPIDTSCPASILRKHRDATLYLDRDSAAGIL